MTNDVQQSGSWAPGYHDDGSGNQPWWDGNAWSQQTNAIAKPLTAVASALKSPTRHPQADSTDTIWSAVGRPLTGLGAHKIRLTNDLLISSAASSAPTRSRCTPGRSRTSMRSKD